MFLIKPTTESRERTNNFLTVENFHRLAGEVTNAYRIFVLPGSFCERWGEDVLISYLPGFDLDVALQQLDVWVERVAWKPRRIFARQLVKQPSESDSPVLVRGDKEFSSTQIVWENGLKYEIDFSGGYSVGLFCDQRSNRKILMQRSPRRMLNCFAYTCAFSVAAASVGSQTVSIDIAVKALARGKKNFNLNGISTIGHRFLVDDVFSVLKRISRKEEKYDCIILDPPTFSRTRKGVFKIERDFPRLLEAALNCAAPGGYLLLSTNCATLRTTDLQVMGSQIAASLGLRVSFYPSEVQCDILGGQSSTSLWMELGK